jgi:alkylhydroperoxidase/carboxymuconolactone decarboxylase family protein YurZ
MDRATSKRPWPVKVTNWSRGEPCLREQVRGALAPGARREEILEAAGVAILIGGGPTAAYCALHLMDELDLQTKNGGNHAV